MGKLFGTDGIRGVANEELTCELALDVGRAVGYVLAKGKKNAKILIGKDTRASCDMLESALCAGICSVGVDAVLLGVVPTPAVAYLVAQEKAECGIVISASHNPTKFNGIKVFSGEGYKLADKIEDEIESYILEKKSEIALAEGAAVGAVRSMDTAAARYVDHIVASVGQDLSGLKVAVDCANGAAFETARLLFDKLGATCYFAGDKPNGQNINDGVGSTHLESVEKLMKRHGAAIGIAFDGDADRCLAVDENGDEIDGDKIIAVFAQYLRAQKKLKKDTAVVTVMTNLGFMDFCAANGINSVRTSVGDRYVLEEMLKNGYSLGGEQSGHIILRDYSTTGDGQMTAALLLAILKQSGKTASELFGQIERYPQVLVNVKADAAQKQKFKDDEATQGFIEAKQQELFGDGRVLVRVSGTEPLIRIMVEGKDLKKIEHIADEIKQKIAERVL